MEEEEEVDFNDLPDLIGGVDPKTPQKKVEDNLHQKSPTKKKTFKEPTKQHQNDPMIVDKIKADKKKIINFEDKKQHPLKQIKD